MEAREEYYEDESSSSHGMAFAPYTGEEEFDNAYPNYLAKQAAKKAAQEPATNDILFEDGSLDDDDSDLEESKEE